MSPLSTNKRIEMEIFRFFNHFSRIYKNGVRYKAERIGERADLSSSQNGGLRFSLFAFSFLFYF